MLSASDTLCSCIGNIIREAIRLLDITQSVNGKSKEIDEAIIWKHPSQLLPLGLCFMARQNVRKVNSVYVYDGGALFFFF